MQSQKQKTTKSNTTSQHFNDVVKSLAVTLEKLYTSNPTLVIFFIFFLLICFYLIVRAINVDYIYSLVVTFLFVFLSICLYIKEKNSLGSLLSFSLGIFTAFTVPWNGATFSIFFISFTILIIFIFFIAAIRAAAKVEERLTQAAISYINDIEMNKKDLKEVVEHVTKATQQGGLLSIHTMWEAVLFFAYQKVPKNRMITLVTGLNRIYTLTKVDTDSLLVLLNNINLLSQTEDSLTVNIAILEPFLLKGKSSPSNLVKILNDTLHIAIENHIEFALFTDTILTYLSHGYTQARILEQLSAKFSK